MALACNTPNYHIEQKKFSLKTTEIDQIIQNKIEIPKRVYKSSNKSSEIPEESSTKPIQKIDLKLSLPESRNSVKKTKNLSDLNENTHKDWLNTQNQSTKGLIDPIQEKFMNFNDFNNDLSEDYKN